MSMLHGGGVRDLRRVIEAQRDGQTIPIDSRASSDHQPALFEIQYMKFVAQYYSRDSAFSVACDQALKRASLFSDLLTLILSGVVP